MIFLDRSMNKPGAVIALGAYHPWLGGTNPRFDDWSARILDLKDMKEGGIAYFFAKVDPMLGTGFAVCAVPSHDPEKVDSGIRVLARRIAGARRGRIDAVDSLVRTQKIEKLAHGGSRDKEVHKNSIQVRRRTLIKGRSVLLIDDVTTSGNSMMACTELLVDAGATVVQPLALGQTT